MNKNNTGRINKKVLSAALALVVVIALIALVAAKPGPVKKLFNSHSSSGAQTASQTTQDINSPPSNTINYGPSSPSDNDQINKQKESAGTTPTPPPTNTQLTATITNTRVASGLAQVSVLVNGTSSGSCALTLSKSGAADVTKTVAITVRENVTTCENFDVPVSSLSSGTWNVSVVLINSDGQSKAATSTLQIP